MPARKRAKRTPKVKHIPPKCVQVRFQNGNTRLYSYITYFDFEIGDFAIVQTPAGAFEAVQIRGFSESFWRAHPQSCKWIVAKLELGEYERVCDIPISELIAATPPRGRATANE